jgi:hypothetical protein
MIRALLKELCLCIRAFAKNKLRGTCVHIGLCFKLLRLEQRMEVSPAYLLVLLMASFFIDKSRLKHLCYDFRLRVMFNRSRSLVGLKNFCVPPVVIQLLLLVPYLH